MSAESYVEFWKIILQFIADIKWPLFLAIIAIVVKRSLKTLKQDIVENTADKITAEKMKEKK